MNKKFSISLIIFISVFMLNVSAMSFQERYNRKEDENENDPFVIEMIDLHVFKFLRNTYFFDIPQTIQVEETNTYFINDDFGFGNHYEVSFKPFLTCQLKFLLIDYIGFYEKKLPERTYYIKQESGL